MYHIYFFGYFIFEKLSHPLHSLAWLTGVFRREVGQLALAKMVYKQLTTGRHQKSLRQQKETYLNYGFLATGESHTHAAPVPCVIR